jgi:hypothetical protein
VASALNTPARPAVPVSITILRLDQSCLLLRCSQTEMFCMLK